LISGVPSISSEPPIMDHRANSLQGKLFFERIVDLLLAVSQTDVLRSLSDICFIADGEGILEFSSGNERVASFPQGKEIEAGSPHSFQLTLSILGRQYNVRASGAVSQHTLEAVAGLLVHRDSLCVEELHDSELKIKEISRFSLDLAVSLEQFSSDSIGHNNAILHIVDSSDPLAGFARTMLYSNETASRITHLLKLSVQTSQDNFMEVYPDRFLTRLHSVFAGKGLRPPSLALADKMPPVLIMPEILLQCFALLCQLTVIDAVVYFKTWKSEDHEEPGVFLSIQGLDESYNILSNAEIHQNLVSGRFNAETESAIIFRILDAAGCSPGSTSGADLIFSLNPAH
ncbi:MAG: hypothetical protein U9P42_06935, partial [Candidatus Fermentibacteria bacterium]|nr:hypothetical protein [Candidatus Fermentibacteria bacterium]